MGHTSLNLASLIGARICHDLISPIGAINNGLELLSMTTNDTSPEMTLMQESVVNANARVRFFRIAFGKGSETERLSAVEISSILHDLGRGAKAIVDWRISEDLTRSDVQALFLSMLCVETALPFGGKIAIIGSPGAFQVAATADKIKIDKTLWENLKTGPVDASLLPSQVQFALLPDILKVRGKELSLQISQTGLHISF